MKLIIYLNTTLIINVELKLHLKQYQTSSLRHRLSGATETNSLHKNNQYMGYYSETLCQREETFEMLNKNN